MTRMLPPPETREGAPLQGAPTSQTQQQPSTTGTPAPSEFLKAALHYSQALGWHVFPLSPRSKIPFAKSHAHLDATTDRAQIESWWTRNPDANIGISLEPSGLVVLDVDVGLKADGTPKPGAASLQALYGAHSDITATLRSVTPTGGVHDVYSRPAGCPANRAIDFLARAIEGQGKGSGLDLLGLGFIVAAPSVRNGQRYAWVDVNTPIAPLPASLAAVYAATSRPEAIERPAPGADGMVAEGGRNDALFKLGCSVRQRQGVSEAALRALLEAENEERCETPVPDDELERIVQNVMQRVTPEADVLLNAQFADTMEKAIAANQVDANGWLEPLPLQRELAPVPKLAPELLPDDMRPWLIDSAECMGVPLELVAIPSLIALSSLVGRRLGICPKQNDESWIAIPSLYGATIVPPGAMKTASAGVGIKPVQELESAARQEHAARSIEQEVNDRILEARQKQLDKELNGAIKRNLGDKPSPELVAKLQELRREQVAPASLRRYFVNDATPERFHEILAENPQGILFYRDELGALFASMAKEGREEMRGLLLTGWGGTEAHSSDRIKRGNTYAPAMCINLFGTIQPDPYLRLVRKELECGDGLVQRFQLAVWPDIDPNQLGVDRKPDIGARSQMHSLFQRVDQLSVPGAKTVPFLHFDRGAQTHFNSWYGELRRRTSSGEIETPGLVAHISKYASLIPALALLLHLASGGSTQHFTQVGLEPLRKALAWGEYLESHARRIYERAQDTVTDKAAELLKVLEEGRAREKLCDQNGFDPRELYMNSRKWKAAETHEACATLLEHGYLRPVTGLTGNKTRYQIHPTLIGGAHV